MDFIIANIIAIIMAVLIACFSCAFGAIAAYRSLEHATYGKVYDGKEELCIRLFLGPFSYTIVVPEKSEGVTP